MMPPLALLALSAADDGLTTMPTLGALPAPCVQATDKVRLLDAPRKAGPRKLGEMPDAQRELTVLRSVDGCPVHTMAKASLPAR